MDEAGNADRSIKYQGIFSSHDLTYIWNLKMLNLWKETVGWLPGAGGSGLGDVVKGTHLQLHRVNKFQGSIIQPGNYS